MLEVNEVSSSICMGVSEEGACCDQLKERFSFAFTIMQ